MSDPIVYKNTVLNKETLLYVKPKDFSKGNVLILSTSVVDTISIIDFKRIDSDRKNLESVTSYRGQFYIIDKVSLPNEILLVINEKQSYVELRYEFFNDVEILSNKFDSHGRLFSFR